MKKKLSMLQNENAAGTFSGCDKRESRNGGKIIRGNFHVELHLEILTKNDGRAGIPPRRSSFHGTPRGHHHHHHHRLLDKLHLLAKQHTCHRNISTFINISLSTATDAAMSG